MGIVEEELEGNKFVIPNTHLDNISETIQYYNKWISQVFCINMHLFIVFRLLIVNKFRVQNDYQILIIVQSLMNILACSSDIAYCEVQTLNINYVKIGHPWWNFSNAEVMIVAITVSVSANSAQNFLMLFNLHRLFIFTKPHKLLKLYCISIPIMSTSTLLDIHNLIPSVKQGRDFDLFFKYNGLFVASVIIVFCYIKLKKHFSMSVELSQKTKKLQEKLSTSTLLQLVMYVIVAILVYFIPEIVTYFVSVRDHTQFFAYQTIVSLVVVQWYPLISSFIIIWSITGFFKSTRDSSASKISPYRKQSTFGIKTSITKL